jgi:hypothetical protein
VTVPASPLLEITATPSPYIYSRSCFNQMMGAACFDFGEVETSPQFRGGVADVEASASTSSEAEDYAEDSDSESSCFSNPPTPRLIVSAPPTPFIRLDSWKFSAASAADKPRFSSLLEAAVGELMEESEKDDGASQLASTFGSNAFGIYDDAPYSLPGTPYVMVVHTPSPLEAGSGIFSEMLSSALHEDASMPSMSSSSSSRRSSTCSGAVSGASCFEGRYDSFATMEKDEEVAAAQLGEERPAEDLEEAKKRRTLEKKLRQITDIDERQRQGFTLNADQLAKVSRKAELEAELQELVAPRAASDLQAKVAQLAELAKGGRNSELEAELRRLLCQQ